MSGSGSIAGRGAPQGCCLGRGSGFLGWFEMTKSVTTKEEER